MIMSKINFSIKILQESIRCHDLTYLKAYKLPLNPKFTNRTSTPPKLTRQQAFFLLESNDHSNLFIVNITQTSVQCNPAELSTVMMRWAWWIALFPVFWELYWDVERHFIASHLAALIKRTGHIGIKAFWLVHAVGLRWSSHPMQSQRSL